MAEKVTTMVLKVDLQCPSCYRKIKKVLAKFPQIQNQAYDEKQNTVTINVVCCSPEKIRDKLCCKGGKTIKSIEIKPPPKSKEPEKPPKAPEKQKGTENPTASDKPKEPDKKSQPPPPAPLVYVPVPVCCGQYYGGIPGGPSYEGYGRPVPSYDGYGYEYGYGGNRACYGVSRCDEYLSEENTSGCTIM